MQLSIVSSDLNVYFRVILDGIIRHTIYTLEHMVLNIFFSSSYSNPCSIWPLRIILKYFSPIICRNIFIFIPWTKVNSYDSQYSIHLSSVKRIIKSGLRLSFEKSTFCLDLEQESIPVLGFLVGNRILYRPPHDSFLSLSELGFAVGHQIPYTP